MGGVKHFTHAVAPHWDGPKPVSFVRQSHCGGLFYSIDEDHTTRPNGSVFPARTDWGFEIDGRLMFTEIRLVCDSDRDPEGAETGTGSVGEADRARAEGIAQRTPEG